MTLTVDVVSDVVCPWCFIGQKKLDLALALVPDLDVAVSWRPYQLDPYIPRGGTDRQAYMEAKFGSMERVNQIHERIEATGRDLGIAFDFAAIKIAVNTMEAHRLIRWAAAFGAPVQNNVVRHLFAANFEQGRNISDPAVLIEIAGESGMEPSVVEALLPTDSDVEAIQGEIATASRMGITGVPCFLLDGRYALMGAQDPDVLADALRQVAARTSEN
jgi:predicted DsbA family dithiol-disulfide isomerase